MSVTYTAPSATTSGASWATLRSKGLRGVISLVASASSLPASALALLISRSTPARVSTHALERVEKAADDFLSGRPIDLQTAITEMHDVAAAFRVFAQSIDDTANLAVANPGTIGHIASPSPQAESTGVAQSLVRTWT